MQSLKALARDRVRLQYSAEAQDVIDAAELERGGINEDEWLQIETEIEPQYHNVSGRVHSYESTALVTPLVGNPHMECAAVSITSAQAGFCDDSVVFDIDSSNLERVCSACINTAALLAYAKPGSTAQPPTVKVYGAAYSRCFTYEKIDQAEVFAYDVRAHTAHVRLASTGNPDFWCHLEISMHKLEQTM